MKHNVWQHIVSSPERIQSTLEQILPSHRDAWLNALWDCEVMPEDDPNLPQGCVPYLPCPVSTLQDVIHCAHVTSADVFVDVGAGLGRATFLVHLLTGAGCVGLEIQPALVCAAQGRAAWRNLSRVRFIEGNALELVRYITVGTVFLLYCPFSGKHLRSFLDSLKTIADTRRIRVCCVDMPRLDVSWLIPLPSVSPTLDVYQSVPLP